MFFNNNDFAVDCQLKLKQDMCSLSIGRKLEIDCSQEFEILLSLSSFYYLFVTEVNISILFPAGLVLKSWIFLSSGQKTCVPASAKV